ncbi:hypothetical protein DFQ28_001539 [Apophysomyces sp. BC1034]|nr:hypothetical protein DFQ30_006436 [Apophysomyces sp. BC1015]KAG0190780.1 hypothetical protein DFQ28_001539 [Apophysomyces sp. BC1034]
MAAFAVYLYSLLSALVFVQGLYGLHTENVRIVRWYTIYFWIDCLVCLGTTVWFAVKWFMFTDHSLPELADDILKQQEHDEMFRMESIVSITLLAVLRLIHIYFAVVVTTYYKSLNTVQYAKLNADPEMVQANFDARIHQKREALD